MCQKDMQLFCVPVGRGVVYLTARPAPNGDPPADAIGRAYQLIRDELNRREMMILWERVFGALSSHGPLLQARGKVLSEAKLDDGGPLTFIEGQPAWGGELAGVQVCACLPGEKDALSVVRHGGRAVGRIWRQPECDVVSLADVHPAAPKNTVDQANQALEMFQHTESILAELGLSFRDVARTWLYLDDILSWYGAFNEVRNARFRQMGILGDANNAWLPASTGIEGSNPAGSACTLDLMAVRIKDSEAVHLHTLHNPRQNEAFSYGSAFARAVCLEEPDGGCIFISGTAAIDDAGQTVCLDDPRGQIDYTLANVEKLLEQTGACPEHICQATLFYKRPEYRELYAPVAKSRGWPEIPAVHARADVCRSELLFELDALAVRPGAGGAS
jgi:enamine deaminase RidA (YjgF/YER057c/UK114 family)